MFELGLGNVAGYLEARGYAVQRIEALGGGVSNTVLLAQTDRGRLVLKQALGKLRVQQDWFSDRTRVLREAAAMRALLSALPAGAVPEILIEDRENCLIAMTAAAASARTWKSQLLSGELRPEIAETIARLLAAQIRVSWLERDWEEAFGNQRVFDELRLDPYYRSTASRHPDLAGRFARLIEASAARRFSAVHGDWSPKNFLVDGSGVMAIDFEVIHYGDPSFDVAFLLNHLALKSFHRPADAAGFRALAQRFFAALAAELPGGAEWFEAATLEHLPALMLARIDGKSPVEYLDEAVRQRVRGFARTLLLEPAPSVAEAFERVFVEVEPASGRGMPRLYNR